jgi:hypothetical protein
MRCNSLPDSMDGDNKPFEYKYRLSCYSLTTLDNFVRT